MTSTNAPAPASDDSVAAEFHPSAAGSSGMSRRRFLQASLTAAAGLSGGMHALASQEAPASAPSASKVLRGFVVSDAHFGWANPEQPSPAQIEATMKNIMRRFPDLDVFIDSGDATHSYGNDLDRGRWMEIIQGGCGRLPFHFITGNHDQAGPWYAVDPEHHVQKLGSHPCRPFYSFDLKNIHHVILPQLMVVSLVTREAVEWLKLDLELNRDKTTLIFSHNALIGTTWGGESGGDRTYRQVANSEELREIFRSYPNVKAWMHGHNHDFVAVEKDGVLFVSNGRIGGFDPHKKSALANSLGGFLFEVGPDHLSVRPYAGNKDLFLDEVPGSAALRRTLRVPTSLAPSAPAAVSFGSGLSVDGQQWPVYNHYAGGSGQELFLRVHESAVMNNDPGFTGFLEGTRGRDTPGYDIKPVLAGTGAEGRRKGKKKAADGANDRVDRTWEFLNPGIKLLKLEDPSAVRRVQSPGGRGTRSNWRCVPGRNYRVLLNLEAAGPGPTVQLSASVLGPDYGPLAQFDSGPATVLTAGPQSTSFEFGVPPQAGANTIYQQAQLDATCYVTLEAVIANLTADVIVRSFSLTPVAAVEGGASATVAGQSFSAQGAISRHELAQRLPARSAVEIAAPGSRALTWLVRQTGLTFQARNAQVEDKAGYLQIAALRHTFSQQEEIILAPLAPIQIPFVHRLRHVNRARIYPWDAQAGVLRIVPEHVFGIISLDVVMAEKPGRVLGAEMWEYRDGLLRVWARGNTPIEIFLA